ncbi:response regulator [Sphingobium sp. JS3065]|jgi:two-component system response regulator FixJ|uniref:response regulator transcription factor n=1 Tax=Sphingobium sp. JS3065 TaxID=2970925 RepID=UPI0022656211|nr:response regulator [Sphingobium sp. JS3065]UZW57103.1 response regulator [Sphingobium sp. JS3065]
MTNKKLVHIIDDEDAIRRSSGYMLKTAGYSVEAWMSGTAFLKDAKSAEEGCILLDVRMPDIDGLEVQRILAERGIAMPIIIMTGHGDISIAVQAMKAGAVDFLEKPFEKTVLIDAIERAFDRVHSAQGVAADGARANVIIGALTGREREVLEGLAQGLPNKTIAYDLGISSRTVEVHRANLMAKLHVHSLSDALRIAFAAGMGRKDETVINT